MTSEKAWVTLATNDTYGLGALVLAHSLKKVKTSYKLVVLITSNVSPSMRGLLQGVYDEVKEVNLLDSGDAENLRLLARPELGVTFTKLHCWKLTQYEKCVFLDADTLVLQNCDELFEREELSAAPDVGWPDCFNSGVFVFKPSEETYQALISFALTHGSFDGGDQGLLNMFFSGWATGDSSKRLPFLFNLSSAAIYSYLPAFKWYGKGVKIVHFIGGSKPWLQPFNPVTRHVQTDHSISHLNNFLQYWWDLFCAQVHPYLSPEMTRLLLRNWITPQISLKNYSYQNIHSRINIKNRHDDIVSETIDRTENESHFVFTDPWDEYESSLVDKIENLDSWSISEEYIPPVIEVVEYQSSHPPKIEETFFQHISNDRDFVVENKSESSAFFENFLEHQEYTNEIVNQSETSTQNCHDDSHNTEIIRPITSHDQSEQTEKSSSEFSVNTNSSLSPSAVDVLPEEKEISNSKVDPNEESGLAQSFSQMKLEEPTPEQLAQEDLQRRLNWEQGNIDYMGKDSFDNIWSKISQSISQAEESPASEKAASPVSPAPVTPPASVPSPVSVPPEPAPAPLQTPAPDEPPKTESLVAQPIESSPSGEPKETVKKVEETPVPPSPSQKEVPPVTPSQAPVSQEPQLPISQPVQPPVAPQPAQPPVTPPPAQPAVTPSPVSQPEPAVCVKPSPVEKQKSQSEVAPVEVAPPKSAPQEPKAPEAISITPATPKSPEVPAAAPEFSQKSAAEVQPAPATSTSTETKSPTPATEPAQAKSEPPSVPAQSTPTAQETKSKQTPKSGGGKKK